MADQQGWNSSHGQWGMGGVTIFRPYNHFLPVSIMVSLFFSWHLQVGVPHGSSHRPFPFTLNVLSQGYLIYFHTSTGDSQTPSTITPESHDFNLPFQSYSPKLLYISYKLAKLNVLGSPPASAMKAKLRWGPYCQRAYSPVRKYKKHTRLLSTEEWHPGLQESKSRSDYACRGGSETVLAGGDAMWSLRGG